MAQDIAKMSFILQFTKTGSETQPEWRGRLQAVELGEFAPVQTVEALVEELAKYGVVLMHAKPKATMCEICVNAGGYPKASN